MYEHWTIGFTKNVGPDLYSVVRSHRDEVRVERRVVQCAECDAVRDGWLPSILSIADNVCRFQKAIALEATNGAMPLVCFEHSFAKLLLMKTLLDEPSCVAAPNVCLN